MAEFKKLQYIYFNLLNRKNTLFTVYSSLTFSLQLKGDRSSFITRCAYHIDISRFLSYFTTSIITLPFARMDFMLGELGYVNLLVRVALSYALNGTPSSRLLPIPPCIFLIQD